MIKLKIKFRNVVTHCVILLTLFAGTASASTYFWENTDLQDEYECEWRYDGCVQVDEDELDLRSLAKQMLDDVYSCKNTDEGCTSEEQNSIDALEFQKSPLAKLQQNGMSPKEFSELLKKHDPRNEQKAYYIPLGLSDKELLTLAAATSLGLVLFPSDGATMNFVQDHKSEVTEALVYPTNNHERLIMGGAALGSYFVGLVIKDNKLKSAGLYVVTTQIATQVVTEGFKRGFGRERPNKGKGPYAFGTDGKSFISGHSAGAWSFATVFAEIYKDHDYIPYLAYGVAALTSYGRLHDNKHFLSDVFFGAVVGHLVTKMVLRMHEGDDSEGGLLVAPSYDADSGIGSLNFQWTPKRKKTKKKFLCEQMPDGPDKIDACIYEAYLRSQ